MAHFTISTLYESSSLDIQALLSIYLVRLLETLQELFGKINGNLNIVFHCFTRI